MTAATRAIAALLAILEGAEIDATRDAGEFDPSPVGVLVSLPSLVRATLGALTFEIPIVVVTSEPLNTPEAVDRIYAIADTIALATSTLGYRPTTWAGSSRAEPLPALEITVTVQVSNEEE